MRMTAEEALMHAGKLMPQRMEERALEALPHYIWMFGRGKEKRGVCSRCHGIFDSREELEAAPIWAQGDPYLDFEGMDEFCHPYWYKRAEGADGKALHGHKGYCPQCGTLITFRDVSRSRGALIDRLVLIDWRKGRIETDTLVMVAYSVTGDWRKTLHAEMGVGEFVPDMDIRPLEICVFRYGKGSAKFVWEDGWNERREVTPPLLGSALFRNAPYLRHKDDTRGAIGETSFGRVLDLMDYEASYQSISLVSWMREIAQYPCLEYLAKLGMTELARKVLDGKCKQLLHLRGKTPPQVLRISGDCWGYLKGHKKPPDENFLQLWQRLDRRSIRLSPEKAWELSRDAFRMLGIDELLSLSESPTMSARILKYLLKAHVSARDVADHLAMMKRQGVPFSDEAILFPANFEEVHGRLAMREKIRLNQEAQERLGGFLSTLKHFHFSALGLVLSPIPSLADVVREGNALSHCVGTYCDRYAAGKTILCTLREEEKMDAPLYTVEFTPDGRMIQCRGYRNRTRPQDEDRLSLFFRLFSSMRRDANERSGRTA